MNLINLLPEELRSHEEKFLAAVNNILSLQKEVNELQSKLDNVMERTQKREFHDGHIVDYENLLVLRQLIDVLQPKREALQEKINNLYAKMLPGDIYIDQHFFETWVSVKPGLAVRFTYDVQGMDMRLEVKTETTEHES